MNGYSRQQVQDSGVSTSLPFLVHRSFNALQMSLRSVCFRSRSLLAAALLCACLCSRSGANGTVTFSNPTNPSTTATFSSSGTYTVTLTASDGVLTTSKSVTIVVVASTPSVIGSCAASGIGGNPLTVPFSFSAGATGITGLQFDVMLPPGVTFNSASAGPASLAASKTVSFSTSTVTNGVRFLVFGINQTPLGSGIILNANMQLASNLVSGTITLPASNVIATDVNGNTVASLTGSCGLTVTANQAPVITLINAPATITLPQTATLSATATDDLSPNPPGMITYSWSAQ